MSANFTLGLVVNTYNSPDYLARVLRAVSRQTSRPDEVVLADDGSDSVTRNYFEHWQQLSGIPGAHAWQENTCFRRSRILNLAIAAARADYLVFLDGDTVPHPQFVADHRQLAAPQTFVQGHRALIERHAAAQFGLGEFSADRRRALLQFQMRGLKHAFRWPRPLRRARGDL
ncbi:MAG: glycosyltransferase, partial [Verrucomicrobia bacterium]|nr:glycosyltransferase [Verrucomicrobiota bacterium]